MDALLRTALADVARIGPYFALDTDPGIAGRPPWRPVTELYGRALPGRIAAAQARLGVEESRVAASLLFQGIAGRLWSPVLGSAVEHGVLPDLTAAGTYWRAASPGPVLLGAPEAGALDADPLAVRRVVVDRHLRPLADAVRAVTPVAEDLLWGNAASALAGTLAVLSRARPAGAARGRRLVTALLGAPPLRGTGRFGPGGFRRRSCCLYYRVPGGGLCGDCALA
jgi:FhuF 2Fe-2S C-terminal domain/Ferric iron reductase FhuF-like transporter